MRFGTSVLSYNWSEKECLKLNYKSGRGRVSNLLSQILKRMNNLKELKIWNRAMELAVQVYKATETFPAEEKFGLTSQSRRAAVSIPSNIAEGAGRNSVKEFNNFLGIANGSSYELQTQLIIA